MAESVHTLANYDIKVQNEGTIFVLYGESSTGAVWLEEHIGHATRWGHGYVVEHRYVEDILVGAVNDGLVVA